MKLQIIQDNNGKDTGVFITIKDWLIIKSNYPDIEDIKDDLPQWEKDLLDLRLDAIAKNPEKLKSGNELLDELKLNQ
ncbi:MAG: hypothetical protein KA479_11060 [Saprospiraceae bacterium]|nr:hypothetical protein [Saprospiraceae bacterium]